MIEEKIRDFLTRKLTDLGIEDVSIVLEIPRNPEHGELSSSIAMNLAKKMHKSPRDIAHQLANEADGQINFVEKIEIAGPGFLNFRLHNNFFYKLLKQIIESPGKYGDSNTGNGVKYLFEFVSANPTGPLNIVSARAASVGDTLVKVFKKRGFNASSEYYVNDGGRQVKLLGATVKARVEQIESGSDESSIPEGGYFGEYVIEIAKKLKHEKPEICAAEEDIIGKWAAEEIHKGQKEILRQFQVEFDNWFFESKLYENHKTEKVLDEFEKRQLTYRKDGALFFQASNFGDDEDRVLIKSNGDYTYVVPDTAYHLDKRDRGNKVAVDILGPDHHGYVKRMNAALQSLGIPDDFLKVILLQQVNLKRDGKEVKMSKRAGIGITLRELIDEVGVDAARFFFLRRRNSSHLDFDMDLAQKHTEENPVYYVQYAHARICSIFRQPQVEELYQTSLETDVTCLKAKEELDILKVLARFPWTLATIVRNMEPNSITTYLTDLSKAFHYFYSKHRVICEDEELTRARLMLCEGVQGVLKEGLRLIGVSTPEKM